MPRIIPIKELKDTSHISALVQEAGEPVFVSNIGYGDMVFMSMETYEQSLYLHDLLLKIDEGELDFKQGKARDAFASLDEVQVK